MTTYSASIVDSAGSNPVHGDHVQVVRTVTGLTTAQVLTKAWLTVKRALSDADGAAALQLTITTASTAAGQITDDGTDDTAGSVTFDINGTDYDGLTATYSYHYDIQVLLDDGTISTIEIGRVTWESGSTDATS